MEVGAVKQAFNNEIILLKKNLNQAKVQTIHKLTRKAKTLTEKKAPEPLKEKLKRKAESAVKEVLIIKKIKPRDIARFIVTHTGKLNDYLNKPIVNNDRACARLLLHKAMQDKYKLIRGKFSNISIKDLFMSRQERLKLKKEAKEKQKNKKKGKNSQTVNVEGEWDVEMTDKSKENLKFDDDTTNNHMSENDDDDDDKDNDNSGNENDDSYDENTELYNRDNFKIDDTNTVSDDVKDDSSNENDKHDKLENKIRNFSFGNDTSDSEIESDIEEKEKVVVNIVKTKQPNIINNDKVNKIIPKENKNNFNDKPVKPEIKRVEKKHKENKNKNLCEKMKKRKFNKIDDVSGNATKVVDPFFITSTGENYMSLVEPRQPDEIKELHKQGNRQYRRAVMFGHVPKVKPKKQHFESNEHRQDKFTNNNKNNINHNRNSFKKDDIINREEVPEKLHPSWEAKKKQSAILPFKGKKIVFDEG